MIPCLLNFNLYLCRNLYLLVVLLLTEWYSNVQVFVREIYLMKNIRFFIYLYRNESNVYVLHSKMLFVWVCVCVWRRCACADGPIEPSLFVDKPSAACCFLFLFCSSMHFVRDSRVLPLL